MWHPHLHPQSPNPDRGFAECKADVYVPYAKHLLAQDKFDEARLAYLKVRVGGTVGHAQLVCGLLTPLVVVVRPFRLCFLLSAC